MSSDDLDQSEGTGVGIEAVMDLADIITSLQDLSDDELKLRGMAIEGTREAMDDPVILGTDGAPVKTWLEKAGPVYPFALCGGSPASAALASR